MACPSSQSYGWLSRGKSDSLLAPVPISQRELSFDVHRYGMVVAVKGALSMLPDTRIRTPLPCTHYLARHYDWVTMYTRCLCCAIMDHGWLSPTTTQKNSCYIILDIATKT